MSISIDSYPNEINESEFTVGFTITGAKKARNYIRVLVYKEGTHSYHGQTWNGATWYEGSSGKEYFAVDIVENEAKASVKAKLPAGLASGEYLLSLKRYTASGNSSDDSVTAQKITVKVPVLVPSQTPAPSVQTSTPKVSVLPQQTGTPIAITNTNEPIVLALKSDPEPNAQSVVTSTPISTVEERTPMIQTPLKEEEQSSSISIMAVIFIVPAVGLISYGSYLFWKIWKDWYTKQAP